MDNVEFYAECGRLLGVGHEFVRPVPWRTRWNNRHAGNGRYAGFGIIRLMGSQIHVALHHPVGIIRVFDSQQDVLDFLREVTGNA